MNIDRFIALASAVALITLTAMDVYDRITEKFLPTTNHRIIKT